MKYLVLSVMVSFALSSCASQQYAALNYGDVTLPNGEHWIIAGGKDETNVSFEVTRADGTEARYTAENANASAALAEMTKIQAQQLQVLSELLSRISGQ